MMGLLYDVLYRERFYRERMESCHEANLSVVFNLSDLGRSFCDHLGTESEHREENDGTGARAGNAAWYSPSKRSD
jgi:hypothetical protein